MIQIVFKNLQKSDLTRASVLERILPLVSKFPGLETARIRVTLEMHNAPEQPGPDLYSVKMQILRGKYRGIRLEKSADTLHLALADLVEHALERLNRYGDRARVRERSKARRLLESFVRKVSFS